MTIPKYMGGRLFSRVYSGEQINEGVEAAGQYREGGTYPCVFPGPLVEDASLLVPIEEITKAEFVAPHDCSHMGIQTVAANEDGPITMTTTYYLRTALQRAN